MGKSPWENPAAASSTNNRLASHHLTASQNKGLNDKLALARSNNERFRCASDEQTRLPLVLPAVRCRLERWNQDGPFRASGLVGQAQGSLPVR